MKKIAILGSTGSIGTQALEVIEKNPDFFKAEILTAGNNADLLIKQAIKFQPDTVVIGNEKKYKQVSKTLSKYPIKVFAGTKSIEQITESSSIDTVLTAMVGFAGLLPTIHAVKSGKTSVSQIRNSSLSQGKLISKLVQNQNKHSSRWTRNTPEFFMFIGERVTNRKIFLHGFRKVRSRNFPQKEFPKLPKKQSWKPQWGLGGQITMGRYNVDQVGLRSNGVTLEPGILGLFSRGIGINSRCIPGGLERAMGFPG